MQALIDYRKEIKPEDKDEMVYSFLKEFDAVCVELKQYDYDLPIATANST